MGQNDWKQDPRLGGMNPDKLKFITDFADRLRTLPKNQIFPSFMTMQMEAKQKGIHFNNSETDLLVSILCADMAPEEKKKVQTLRMLAQKMAARSS